MKFHKYQAIGNDYLVVDVPYENALAPALVRRLCDRNFGIGSDGILIGKQDSAGFALRIFNPDGSEAEKSGNGLRIFARYLWDKGLVRGDLFNVATKGGGVVCQVRDSGRTVFVEMGCASFDSSKIPVNGPKREVIGDHLEVDGQRLRFAAVTLGNPHCVIHCEDISAAVARRLGPLIETHALFPNRTNVQFVKVLDRQHIQIEIWERGAGDTLASGSSSCAAAAASVKLGLCAGDVKVSMPGGTLEITVRSDFSLAMVGAVEKVADGTVAQDLLSAG